MVSSVPMLMSVQRVLMSNCPSSGVGFWSILDLDDPGRPETLWLG